VPLANNDAPDFRALFEGAPGLYLVLSPSFEIVAASESYLRATLTNLKDILGRSALDVFPDSADTTHGKMGAGLHASLERVIRNGVADTLALLKYDLPRSGDEGGGIEERYWSPVNSPVLGAQGQVLYIISRLDDVTDLTRFRQARVSQQAETRNAIEVASAVLQQSKEIRTAGGGVLPGDAERTRAAELEFRALFDFMPQPGWTARPDGFRDFYNRRWYEYSGTTFEEMEGWGWKALHDPAMLPLVLAKWHDSLRTGRPFEMEFKLRGADGTFHCFLTRATAIRDAEENIIRWVGISTDIESQRKATQAEGELQAAILSNMTEGVCLVRASDNVFVYTNPKFEMMLRYLAGELLGKPIEFVTLPGAEETRRLDGILTELKNKGDAVYEIPLRRKDATQMLCRAHASRLETLAFGPVWVAVAEDITERKANAEEGNSFFDLSFDLLAISTLDGYFKRLSKSWESALGWTREELMAKQWLELLHPDDVQATLAAVSRISPESPVLCFENRYRCKSGAYRWLQWSSLPVPESNVIYCVAHDITEERAAKVALRELSTSLETTLHSIGDGVIATDVDGAVIRMNPVAESMTGWSIAEAKGQPFAQRFTILDEDSRTPIENPIERALRADPLAALTDDTLLVRRNGSEVAISHSCAPIRAEDGTVSGAVLVIRDLTAARAATAIQAKYQQQLVFADRMASVGTLAAGVAHEINNPLTYITANIDTVIEEIRALSGGSASGRMKDIEDNLVEAREGATRVARIVRGLKTFSRIDEERLGVVDLIPVLELSINMSFNEIRHRARLVKDYGKLPLIDGDDARLGQVFINLLVNAAQALPEGTVDANEIRITTSTDANGRAVVEVHDTGQGMAPALIARIFDPFFTTKPVGVGTGLGLAICHNIVTGMGGEISVQSEVGKGTTFRVVLPPSQGAIPLPKSTRRLAVVPLRPASVLVVDDEPSVGFAVRRVLKNHEVTVVTTAQEALDLLATGREFDVILSDLMMPKMSGIDFHAALARLHPKMASRVVFVTGGAFTPEANAFLDRVTNERMEKPFDLHQLREMVQKFVKEARPAAA
jgi:PAS domain S-box-containing protein